MLVDNNSSKAKILFQETLRDTLNEYIISKGINEKGYFEFAYQLAGLGV